MNAPEESGVWGAHTAHTQIGRPTHEALPLERTHTNTIILYFRGAEGCPRTPPGPPRVEERGQRSTNIKVRILETHLTTHITDKISFF